MKKKQTKLNLPPRAQLAFAFVVPLLVLGAGWVAVVEPQRSKAADLATQISAAQTQLQAAQAAELHPPKQPPIRVADVFRLTEAMPDQQDMPGIILQLDDVAQEAGISFNAITPQSTQLGAGYQIDPIKLDFSGNYYALSDFLYRLRSLVSVRSGKLQADGRLFSVQSISFAEGKPAFPQIDATLVVDAYVYGIPAPAVPTTPVPTGTDTSATTTGTTSTTAGTTTPAPTTGTPTAAGATTGVNG